MLRSGFILAHDLEQFQQTGPGDSLRETPHHVLEPRAY